jgi:hypothetical protein
MKNPLSNSQIKILNHYLLFIFLTSPLLIYSILIDKKVLSLYLVGLTIIGILHFFFYIIYLANDRYDEY